MRIEIVSPHEMDLEAGRTISEAEVRELLLATQNAPSWANQQPSKYYVAIGQEKREAVRVPYSRVISPIKKMQTRSNPDKCALRTFLS